MDPSKVAIKNTLKEGRMKDIIGQGLNEGDEVIFNPPHYKGIVLGTIINFTEKMVRVKFEPTGSQRFDEVLVLPQNLMKTTA